MFEDIEIIDVTDTLYQLGVVWRDVHHNVHGYKIHFLYIGAKAFYQDFWGMVIITLLVMPAFIWLYRNSSVAAWVMTFVGGYVLG